MKISSREFIVRKSSQLFNQKGVLGTTISDVCESIGMTKGSIYANFKDKDELALEVFKHNIKVMSDKLSGVLALKTNPHDKLMIAIEWFENVFSHAEFEYGCPLANITAEVDDTNPKIRKHVNNTIKNDVVLFEKLIQDAISKGIYSRNAHLSYAKCIVASIEGALLLSKSMNNQDFLKEVCKEVRQKLTSWLKK